MNRYYRLGSLLTLTLLILSLWAIEYIDLELTPAFPLNIFGIHPRNLFGLVGIPLMPLLHSGYDHVAGNTIGLILFGATVIWQDRHEFWVVFVAVTLMSGLGIWLLGDSNSVHIGASGVVYGFFGYLLALGYFERSFSSILRACLILFFFNGLLWIDPTEAGISWEGHLFGLLSGIWVASESWG